MITAWIRKGGSSRKISSIVVLFAKAQQQQILLLRKSKEIAEPSRSWRELREHEAWKWVCDVAERKSMRT
jgi:hypothetical protein